MSVSQDEADAVVEIMLSALEVVYVAMLAGDPEPIRKFIDLSRERLEIERG